MNEHDFVSGTTTFESVAAEQNSYYLTNDQNLRPTADNLSYTEEGVPLRVIAGEKFDHPVLQAQFMLKHLNTLRRTGSPEHSAVLHATAKHILSYAIESRGASFLPFKFPWNAGKQQPPWYSAMAQGQVLSAISRLHEIEPRPEYPKFAQSLFESFELLPNLANPNDPWVVDIDDKGYLWLEEYPFPGQGKCVLNGHLFSVWGLYDYWRVFGVPRALEIATAGLETTKKYMRESRTPNWSSHYDLTNFFLIRNYHQTHIWQLETTYNLTGNPYFLELADQFEKDFPSYQRNGSMYLAVGEHIIHKFDNIAVPTLSMEAKTIRLDKAKAFKFAVRTKVEELEGIWLRFQDDEFEGWWIQETPKKAFPRMCFDRHNYARRRRLLLKPGIHSQNSFNEWGSAIRLESENLKKATLIPVSSKAMWNGVWYYQIAPECRDGFFKPGNWIKVEDQETV